MRTKRVNGVLRRLTPGLLAGAAVLLAATSARPSHFSFPLVDLGTLGGSHSYAYGLNDNGHVVGASTLAGDGAYHAFLYSPLGMQDLGTLGGASSSANHINAAGQVAGLSAMTGNTATHAFRKDPLQPLKDLGTLGGASSWPVGINAGGDVAGTSQIASAAQPRAFLYRFPNGPMLNLGSLGGSASWAVALNDAGMVCGRSYLADDTTYHAFRYEPVNGASPAVLRDLGTLGGARSWARAINSAGQVIGHSDTADGTTHAFLWTRGAVDGVPGNPEMKDLGTLGGQWSWAAAVNDAGTVTGYSQTTAGEWHAFRYDSGGMQDLGTLGGGLSFPSFLGGGGQVGGSSETTGGPFNAFLAEGGGLQALAAPATTGSTAIGINNAGEIVGESGTADKKGYRAFRTGPGGLFDLGTLGGTWSWARAINNTGQIIGVSTLAGDSKYHAYILSSSGVMYCTGNDGSSLVRINTATGAGTVVGPIGIGATYAAAFHPNGTLYTMVDSYSANGRLATLNKATGAATVVGNPVGITNLMILEFANDGTLYAASWTTDSLYRINLTTGLPTLVGPLGFPDVMDFAFHPNGTLYAVNDHDLYTVNLTTGQATHAKTITGATGIMGLTFDPAGNLFATSYRTNSPLYRINLTTGAATSAGSTGINFPHGGDIIGSAFPNGAPTASAGGPYTAVEGGSVMLSGSGSDPDGEVVSYAWDLDNDGLFETPGQNALFSAAGMDGPSSRNVNLRVNDPHGLFTVSTAAVSVLNVAPNLMLSGDPSVDEGSTYTLNLASSDPGQDTISGWTINWGDGSPPQMVPGNPSTVTHVFEDGPSSVTITGQATDEDGTFTANNVPVNVKNVSPSMDAGGDASANEGTTFTRSVPFADPGADVWTAVVDYGDGSGVQPAVVNADKTVSLNHLYADDDPSGTPQDVYTVTLKVRDDDGGEVIDDFAVTVKNLAPDASIVGAPATADEGTAISLTSTVTDPGAADTFTYEWTVTKDGVPYGSPGSGAAFSCTPDDNGSYVVTLKVTDDDTGTDTATATIGVINVAPKIEDGDLTFVSPIKENDTLTLDGKFIDPGTADNCTVTINWGDGASETFDVGPTGMGGSHMRMFSRMHQYLDDDPTGTAADDYTIMVTVTDDDAGSDSAQKPVTVENVAPVLGADAPVLSMETISENDQITLTAGFTDVGSKDTFKVTIDWGDMSPKEIRNFSPADRDGMGGFQIMAMHRYLDDNPTGTPTDQYIVSVTVEDDDTGTATATRAITVNNVNPVLGPLSIDNSIPRTNDSIKATTMTSDVGTEDDLTVKFTWKRMVGGGGMTVVQETVIECGPAATTHTDTLDLSGADKGDKHDVITVEVTVTDDDTGTDGESASATVQNTPPVAAMKLVHVTSSEQQGPDGVFRARPDHLKLEATVSDVDGDNLDGNWLIQGMVRTGASSYENGPDYTIEADIPAGSGKGESSAMLRDVMRELDTTDGAAFHLPHGKYVVRLEITDNDSGLVLQDAMQVSVPGTHTSAPAEDGVPNLSPHVFATQWYRSSDLCEEVTDTPAADAHATATSLVAAAELGTETAPGVYLNATGAACDADGDKLEFTFLVDSAPKQVGPSVQPPGAVFQTRKLTGQPLADFVGHTLQIRVDDSGDRFGHMDDAGSSDTSAQVTMDDPRAQLREELKGLGYNTVEQFQDAIAPIIERVQADYRITGWGTGSPMQPQTELGYYAANPPVYYLGGVLGGMGKPIPALLDLVDGRSGATPPANVSGNLARLDEWAQKVVSGAILTPQEEARGEFFTALFNMEKGLIGLGDYPNLVAPVPADLTIYRRMPGGPGCFPRVPAGVDPSDSELPDQFYTLGDALRGFANTAFVSLFGQPPSTPPILPEQYLNQADTARLFNERTVFFQTDAFGPVPFRHRPHVPQVKIHAAVSGAIKPAVCWTFSDAKCSHVQEQVIVKVGDTEVLHLPQPGGPPAAGVRETLLTGVTLNSGQVYTVTVKVYDGFAWTERSVPFRMP